MKTLKQNLSKSNFEKKWRWKNRLRMNSKILRLVNALKDPYPSIFIYKNKKIKVSDVKVIKKKYYNID